MRRDGRADRPVRDREHSLPPSPSAAKSQVKHNFERAEGSVRSFGPVTQPDGIYRRWRAAGHNPEAAGELVQRKGHVMSSALACIGLGVSDDAEFNLLVKNALLGIREVGTFGGVYVGRWQDDSGATLILGLQDGQIADFTFAYAGTSGGLLADCRLIYQSIAWAKVTD